MKLLSIFLVGWLLLATNSYDAPKEVMITGKVYTGSATTVTYTVPHNGVFHWGFKESVKTDTQGNFQIKIPCEQASIIAIGVDDRHKRTMVISSGDHFTLQLGADKDEDFFELKGPNEAGQKLFRELPNPGFVQIAAHKYFKDTLVADIEPKIEEEKAKELAPFIALLKAKKISPAFFELVTADRDCYYATMKTQLVFVKLVRTKPEKIAQFSPAFKNWAQETFQKYPLENPRLISSFWWYEYAKTFQDISMYLAKDFDAQNLETQYKNGTTHTFTIKDAEGRFKGKYLELFQAYYLYDACLQKHYEKELIGLFEQFKKSYPQSPYSKHIEVWVDPIVEYHKLQESSLSEHYKLIENAADLNSLAAALETFKGKKLYIDVWATWCGPCKKEFEYKEALKKLLSDQGYEILYVSIDEADRTESWKGMIKYYKLEGHHLLANEALTKDLRRIYNENGSISIPWYLIVNQKGELVVKDAARPSDVKTLEKQLKGL